MNIPFIDLKAQFGGLESEIRAGSDRVLEHGQFIMGSEVRELERELARFAGVEHAVTCSSGTDALLMPLLAYGVGPGDAILTTPFTFSPQPRSSRCSVQRPCSWTSTSAPSISMQGNSRRLSRKRRPRASSRRVASSQWTSSASPRTMTASRRLPTRMTVRPGGRGAELRCKLPRTQSGQSRTRRRH